MMSGNFGFMGGFMWIYWVLIIIGLVFFIRWIVQQNKPHEPRPSENSLEFLKKRYAHGEINREEFKRRKKDILS